MEIIRRFHRKRFAVVLTCEYDASPDLSWADADTLRQIDDGDLACYVFKVAVMLDGREIGADYLGSSVYADPHEFAREHLGIRRTKYGCYFSDMMHTAIAEARATLHDIPRLRC